MGNKFGFNLFLIACLASMLFLFIVPSIAQAAPSVTITFATSGLTSYNDKIITIEGISYTVSDLGWKTFKWKPGTQILIEAQTPVTGWDNNIFRFSSWTNGNGLTGSSGYYTVPNSNAQVTVNYVKTTVSVTFAASGLSTYNGGTVLTIDGNAYDYYNLPSMLWETGSKHSVNATSALVGYDGKNYAFANWTNGNGLTGLSGTLTVPSAAVTVTANYALGSTKVTFATNGLSNYDGQVFSIDGQTYDFWNLPSFDWIAGQTHSVTVSTHITGWDGNVYNFTSWTNGNGLVGTSGTFTVPASSTTVTANYITTTVTVTFATSGLSNYDGQVVTVDGATYDFWNMPSFLWEIGTTHDVSALSPVTGWDSVTHQFASWTNGNGLTEASGTLLVPSDDVTVTVNYGASATPAATILTIQLSPLTIDTTTSDTTTVISGDLTSSSEGIEGKTITLTYFDGANWLPIASTTTQADGSYSYSWTLPTSMQNGEYVIKAEFAGDSNYQESSAATQAGSSLLVLPEYGWGGLAALLTAFSALLLFKMRGKLTSPHKAPY